jgi:hypothetical protein
LEVPRDLPLPLQTIRQANFILNASGKRGPRVRTQLTFGNMPLWPPGWRWSAPHRTCRLSPFRYVGILRDYPQENPGKRRPSLFTRCRPSRVVDPCRLQDIQWDEPVGQSHWPCHMKDVGGRVLGWSGTVLGESHSVVRHSLGWTGSMEVTRIHLC